MHEKMKQQRIVPLSPGISKLREGAAVLTMGGIGIIVSKVVFSGSCGMYKVHCAKLQRRRKNEFFPL